MIYFQRAGENEPDLRVTTYTLPDELDETQKKYKKQVFLHLVIDLLLAEACLFAGLIEPDLFVALVGIIAVIRAVTEVRRYHGIVLGDGLRTDYYFFGSCIRVFECGRVADVSYDKVKFASRLTVGLVIRFEDGSGRVLSSLALSEAGNEDELLAFLRAKLGDKFHNKLADKEYTDRVAKTRADDKARRETMLGRQLSAVFYEVDGIDRRDYCRLLMKTGKTGVTVRVLTSVFGAVCTAAAIFSLLTENDLLTLVCYGSAVLLICLLLLRYVGLGGPARRRFFSAADGREVAVYLHENGVWVDGDRGSLGKTWKELDGFCYDEDIGIAFDMGKRGVAFVPVDVAQSEILSLVRDRAAEGRKREG